MDDLSFRKSILANPNHSCDDTNECIENDPAKLRFVQDVKVLDQKIHRAAKIPVPEHLAQQLILRQSMQDHHQQQTRNRWHLAIAASIAFAVGIMLNNYWLNPQLTLGDHALAHVYHELQYSHHFDENLDLASVNTKLVNMGASFTHDIGKVYFANYCDFEKVRSLHIVMQGEVGKISVFVVPDDQKLRFDESFSDKRFNGTAFKGKKANMVIVGEKQEPLEKTTSKLKNSLRWQA